MAPDDTSTTSTPAPCRAARTSTRLSTRSPDRSPLALVSDDEPTFTTTRRAAATSPRICLPAFQSDVAATRPELVRHTGSCRRFPVEGNITDDDLATGFCTEFGQR